MNLEELFPKPVDTEAEMEARTAAYLLKIAARADCNLCDNDGYRGLLVCDHVNRFRTHTEGMRKVRRALKNPNIKEAS